MVVVRKTCSFLLGSILFLYLLIGGAGAGASNGNAQTVSTGEFSRIAVLPLKNLNDVPEQAAFGLMLQKEISFRLMLKGYDVIDPSEVNKIVHGTWSPENEDLAIRKLNQTFKPDAVVVGGFSLEVDNYIVATKGSLSSEVTFKDPNTGRLLMRTYEAKDEKLDKTLLGDLSGIASLDPVSAVMALLIAVPTIAMKEYPTDEKRRQRLLTYVAYLIVKNVPQGPDKTLLPRIIDHFGANGCFRYGDEVELGIVVQGDYRPGRNHRILVVIDRPGRNDIEIVLENLGRIWRGSHTFYEKDSILRSAPVSIFFEKSGQRFFMGKIGDIDVKTKKPEIPELFYVKEGNFFYFLWTSSEEDQSTYEIHKRSSTGEWILVDSLKNPSRNRSFPIPLSQFREGDIYKMTVEDRCGNRSDSKEVHLERCRQRSDVFYMISKLPDDDSICFREFIHYFEEQLKSRIELLEKKFQTRNASCASKILHFQFFNEPFENDRRINIREIESGQVVCRGKYPYAKDGSGSETALIDRENIERCLKKILPANLAYLQKCMDDGWPSLCPDSSVISILKNSIGVVLSGAVLNRENCALMPLVVTVRDRVEAWYPPFGLRVTIDKQAGSSESKLTDSNGRVRFNGLNVTDFPLEVSVPLMGYNLMIANPIAALNLQNTVRMLNSCGDRSPSIYKSLLKHLFSKTENYPLHQRVDFIMGYCRDPLLRNCLRSDIRDYLSGIEGSRSLRRRLVQACPGIQNCLPSN